MGFGILFIGYLLAFLLYLTVQALGFGSLALLGGYAIMFYALCKLSRYESTFLYAKWTLPLLFLTGVYHLLLDLSGLLLWKSAFLEGTFLTVANWITFLATAVFQFALLYGIRVLAMNVELRSLAAASMRDSVVYGIYACLYLVGNLSFAESFRKYLTLSTVIFNILWVALILILIVSCAKNICPAGDEEVTPRRSRFAWLNRIADAYEESQKRMRNQAREDGEALRRRHEERKKRKKKK